MPLRCVALRLAASRWLSFQEDGSFVISHDPVPMLINLFDSDSGNKCVIDPGPRCSSRVLQTREREEETCERMMFHRMVLLNRKLFPLLYFALLYSALPYSVLLYSIRSWDHSERFTVGCHERPPAVYHRENQRIKTYWNHIREIPEALGAPYLAIHDKTNTKVTPVKKNKNQNYQMF